MLKRTEWQSVRSINIQIIGGGGGGGDMFDVLYLVTLCGIQRGLLLIFEMGGEMKKGSCISLPL